MVSAYPRTIKVAAATKRARAKLLPLRLPYVDAANPTDGEAVGGDDVAIG